MFLSRMMSYTTDDKNIYMWRLKGTTVLLLVKMWTSKMGAHVSERPGYNVCNRSYLQLAMRSLVSRTSDENSADTVTNTHALWSSLTARKYNPQVNVYDSRKGRIGECHTHTIDTQIDGIICIKQCHGSYKSLFKLVTTNIPAVRNINASSIVSNAVVGAKKIWVTPYKNNDFAHAPSIFDSNPGRSKSKW